jgi:hypothetical protein
MNFIVFVLSEFRINLLAANCLIIGKRTKCDNEEKSSKFLLDIMTLESPANNIGCDIEMILGGRSFIYIMNCRGRRIDAWGTTCFIVPQSQKKISCTWLHNKVCELATVCLLWWHWTKA